MLSDKCQFCRETGPKSQDWACPVEVSSLFLRLPVRPEGTDPIRTSGPEWGRGSSQKRHQALPVNSGLTFSPRSHACPCEGPACWVAVFCVHPGSVLAPSLRCSGSSVTLVIFFSDLRGLSRRAVLLVSIMWGHFPLPASLGLRTGASQAFS